MKRRQFEPTVLVGLRGHPRPARASAARAATGLAIGAGTTLTAVAAHAEVAAHYPALATAAGLVSTPAAPQHGHARRQRLRRHALQLLQPVVPVAEGRRLLHEEGRRDLPRGAGQPALLGGVVVGHRARAVEPGRDGAARRARRASARIPIAALYRDDGIQYLSKQPDEVLTEIVLPPADGWRSIYLKLRRRGSFDFPVLGVAAALSHGRRRRAARRASCWAPSPRCPARRAEAARAARRRAPHRRS